MRIGIDLSVTNFNKAGNARYATLLYRNLKYVTQQTGDHIIPFRMPIDRFTSSIQRKALVLYWEFVYIPYVLSHLSRHYAVDVLHITQPVPIQHVKVPILATIHDLAPFLFPQWFGKIMGLRLRRWMKATVASSRAFIAVSQATANDLARVFPETHALTHVIHEASFLPIHDNDEPIIGGRTTQESDHYILFVGTIEPRKNLHRVLEAYSALKKHLANVPKLVLVGGKGWKQQDLRLYAQKLGVLDDIIVPGFVSDQQLRNLYARARLLIFPSLYEGFGFPVLEAMSMGCPVITSNRSSLPEIAGNAALLVDPTSVPQISRAMQVVLGNRAMGERMRYAGFQQARCFSWEACAAETLQLYKVACQAEIEPPAI